MVQKVGKNVGVVSKIGPVQFWNLFVSGLFLSPNVLEHQFCVIRDSLTHLMQRAFHNVFTMLIFRWSNLNNTNRFNLGDCTSFLQR